MKRLVPTLSLLALAGFAAAEVISDDAAKITVGLYYQARMDISRGSTMDDPATAGDQSGTYSPGENANGKPDTADFYFRRLRPSIKGTYGDGFIFQVTLSGDGYGKPTPAATVSLFDAFAGRKFTVGDLTHTVMFGKKNAWFYTANFNSATNLLPSMRPATPVGVPNQVGLGYLLESAMVRFGFDILNNVSAGVLSSNGDDAGSGSQTTGEGLWYSARIELTGAGDWSSKWMESFAGKPGHGFVIAAEVGRDSNDRTAVAAPVAAGTNDATVIGFEAMLHVDGLTAVADLRHQKTTRDLDVGANPDDVSSRTISVQAGYAVPSGIALMPMIEPAARFAKIDNNRHDNAEGPRFFSANGDYGTSGRTIEFGVNGYFNGHKNKISLDYLRWQGEENAAGSDASANIFRVQHQLWF